MEPGDIDLVPVRCEVWGGCAWINLDPDAPPLRDSLEPAASILDEWKVESLRSEWWYACRLPVNWKLAIEAFVEAYHVAPTHPQLVIPTRYGRRDSALFDARAFVDADLQYLRTMSEGMAGMVHADDVRVAEGLRDTALPSDADAAIAAWNRTLNDAVVAWHRDAGHDMPDLNDLTARGLNLEFFQCFPHYFVLPMYSSATAYRFRPLGPEETLMELWSLTRFSDNDERERPAPPELWPPDDPRWPPIPAQDFSNLPRQQKGLHARGFEYMRLSETMEGHVSNFERTVDGFLAGLPFDRLAPALQRGQRVPVRPTDRRPGLLTMADLTFADVAEGVRADDRGVHAGARRRPHRRRRRNLLRRRRVRHPRPRHLPRARRVARRVRSVDAAPAAASPGRQHARHRLERPRGPSGQRRRVPPPGRRRAGRSSSSAATTTRSTATATPWRFHQPSRHLRDLSPDPGSGAGPDPEVPCA